MDTLSLRSELSSSRKNCVFKIKKILKKHFEAKLLHSCPHFVVKQRGAISLASDLEVTGSYPVLLKSRQGSTG